MTIDQRNAGSSVTVPASNVYTVDRWNALGTQASKFTVQQSSTAPAGFVNSLKLTSSSAYSLSSTDAFQLQQYIEGFNTADLGFGTSNAKTVTLSFWVQSSLTGTFGMWLTNNDGSRIYPTSYVINSANTWEYKTITLTGDLTGSWTTNNTTGLRIVWTLGYGSNYTGATANAWSSGSLYVPSGCVNFVGTNGATFYITGVQLEVGSTATSFDYRPYGTELILCQRYFEKTWQGGATPTDNSGIVKFAGNVFNFNGTSYCGTFSWKVQKRTNPTIRVWSNSPQFTLGSWTGYTTSTGTDVAVSVIDDSTTVVNLSVASSTYTFIQGHIEGSSEL